MLNNEIVKQYSFIDPVPVSGTVCYRIKEVEENGKIHYSHVVSFKDGNSFSVKVAPNPATTAAVLYITTTKAENISIQISSVNGQIVSTKSMSMPKGNHTLLLNNLDMRARGNYIIKITTSDGIFYQKLLLH